MMKLSSLLSFDARSGGVLDKFFAGGSSKSLRDMGWGGLNGGAQITVLGENRQDVRRLFRKANVALLRGYAEFSSWVRAAIDIYRQEVAMAEPQVSPVDPERPMDLGVERAIKRTLSDPNPAEISYSELKEMFTEDFLVIGHGAIEKQIKVNLQPSAFYILDAARIAFVQGWDGSDLSIPRYAELQPDGRVVRWFPDAMCMVLVNRPRSYDKLGLSHVEVLDTAVRALLEGDQTLLNQMLNPAASGMLDLGKGVPPKMVSQIRSEMEHLRHAMLVIANSENSRFHSFEKVRSLMRQLDAQIWFVRQVASVFQIPMSKLQVAVDESRANTEAQFREMDEGTMALLRKVRDLENANITLKYGAYEKHNCKIDYPVLATHDALEQAKISQVGVAGQPFMSPNDARRAQGLETLDKKKHPGAEELWFKSAGGFVPLSSLELKYFKNGKPVAPEEPVAAPPEKPAESGQDSETVN